MKKFLKYYRFALLVTLLVFKYRVLLLVMTDRRIIQYLVKRFDSLKAGYGEKVAQLPKGVVTRRVNVLFRKLYPRAKCLVRSVVLNEILILNGHIGETIKFGLKQENEQMLAHAWIGAGGDFNKIYEL